MEYIVIQAGGRGSRLEILTANKPKALVPVDNLPMIFHLFKKYPEAKFKIIADYKKDVLKKYLKAFAKVDYEVIAADKKGTCAGLSDALATVPDHTPFMLIWCDLILSNVVGFPEKIEDNYLGISKDFECRWSYREGQFEEKPSKENGVAGMFLFKDKSLLKDVPHEGEFVRWLSTQGIHFKRLDMYGGLEVGTMLSYFQNELNKPKCRPFNKMEFTADTVSKIPLDAQGEKLGMDEIAWYKKVTEEGYTHIPTIYNYAPLTMKRIKGENVYTYSFLTPSFKKALLDRIIVVLTQLHNLTPPIEANEQDCEENYITKTFDRLEKVKDLVPFAKDDFIMINGVQCQNIFNIKDKIIQDIRSYYPKEFHFIHGDCTFSNMLIKTEGVEPILIDPRGYFGKTKFYGDVDYDWAKLYYSLAGDYDQFNRKNFSLKINDESVELSIMSNNWKDVEDYFFEKSKTNRKKIYLLHAIIWLSLTTYAWEDYDAICGAFYNGLYHLNEYLKHA